MTPCPPQSVVLSDLGRGALIHRFAREDKAFNTIRRSTVDDQIEDLGWEIEETHFSVVGGNRDAEAGGR